MIDYNSAIYLDDIPKEQWKNYIGNGYRYICYTTDSSRHGQIILFGFDLQGNRKTFVCPWQSHVTYKVKYQTGEYDVYDSNVQTKYFDSKYLRDKFVENIDSRIIVECLKPEQEFTHFMFDEHVLEDNFNSQALRIHYFDIETEISDRFERPVDARNRINMMTIYDSQTEKFYTWSLSHAEKKFVEDPLKDYPLDKFVFFEFNNDEEKLLEHFISWIEDNYPDVSFGWNTRAYDWPYVVRRIENVLGKEQAKRLSPVGRYFIKEVKHDQNTNSDNQEIEVDITGLFIADGLILYRDKFLMSGASLDGGYSLDNVGEHEGCGHKIKYNGTLKDLYLKDYQKFYEYNVRDVDLAKRICDKRQIAYLARRISSYGLTNYSAIYSSISYLIGSVIAFTKTQFNGKIFNSYLPEKKKFDGGFEGAFVFPTVPGVYRGGVGTIDFASLYPSNIRSINASPETFVGKVLVYYKDEFGNPQNYLDANGHEWPCNEKTEPMFNIFDDEVAKSSRISRFELKRPDGRRQVVTLDQLRKLVQEKCIYTANNTLFLKHEVKWGVITKWCEYFYGLRKATKKKMFVYEHKLHNEKDKMTKEEIEEAEMMEENLNVTQLALKCMINSIYGMLGTAFSPIAHPDIAQSVTRQGRFCNQSSAKFILSRFQKLFSAPEDYTIAISGDTDSIFLNLQCVTDYLKKKMSLPEKIKDWTSEQRQVLWDVMFNFVEKEVNPFVRGLVHDYCHTTQQDVLTYELEYMGDCGVYETKKHYLLHKIFEDGDVVDKIKSTGIELKKAQVPKEMKKFLEDIYLGVVNEYWTEKDYQNYINNLYDKFSKFSIDEISLWKGYNTERQATGFLQMQLGVTGIAKSCIYYNQIIEKLGLGKKYETINVGDKVRQCYIKPENKFGIDIIAYKPGQWPEEFNALFEIDYRTMFNKIILDPLKRFRQACHFKDSDPSKQVQFDIFEL